jgi:Domain of unknown function (DUF4159)
MRYVWLTVLASLIAGTAALPAPPRERPKEELAEKVRVAIQRGVQFLKDRENGKGYWEEDLNSAPWKGGWTGLAMLALLNPGVPPNDPVIQRGLKTLRDLAPDKTYVVGLQTMVFVQAGYPVDRDRIKRNVDWLLKARLENGWTYSAIRDSRGLADYSNTQYALLGLHEGLRSGVKIPEEEIKAIRSLYLRGQRPDGSWGYRYRDNSPSRMTMTAAGLCGLLITGMDLDSGKQILRPDGSAENCGVYEYQKPVADAMQWLGQFPSQLDNATIGVLGYPFYCLYGIERAGRLSGRRFLGGNDWYRIGCEYLVRKQESNDGSWEGGNGFGADLDRAPIVATSFSLLFLSKGRTPVLLTKLAYGARGSEGWNNKHNDTRHLVEFASKDLFKNQPLAWQVFDARGMEAGGDERVRDLAAQMLQSPIVYFNGHDLVGWSGLDGELLKEYVANGGFVLIENCCGKAQQPRFDDRIHTELARLFETPLAPLSADHPVFTGKYIVSPGAFPLEGIQQGCKTVVVYSPVALAGYWEADDQKSERGRKAFELAANVIAYATGLELPKPRLTNVEVFSGDSEREEVRRGFLKVAQLEHGGDWHPAPKAMRNLMAEARKDGLDVLLATRDLAPSDPNLFDYRFVYMHGRKPFELTDSEKKHLRFLLKSGGLLFADACCGSKAFDTSFRALMEDLWSGDKRKLEPIPPGDPLFGAELNGEPIMTVRCRREGPDGKRAEAEYRDVAPSLEGVKVNGRWVVIYSRYDIGCALEKHPSGDCLGHTYESAVALGKAALQYALRR